MKNLNYTFSSAQCFVAIMMLTGRLDSVEGYASTPTKLKMIESSQHPQNLNIPVSAATTEATTTLKHINNDKTTVKYDLGLGKNPPFGINKSKKKKSQTTITTKNEKHIKQQYCVYDAVRFWVEHESVNKLPSPLDNIKQQQQQQHLLDNDGGYNNSFFNDVLRKTSHPENDDKINLESSLIDKNNNNNFIAKQKEQNNSNNKKRKSTIIRPRPTRSLEDELMILYSREVDASTNYNDREKGLSLSPSSSSSDSTTGGAAMMIATTKSRQRNNRLKLDVNTVWVEMLIHKEQQQLAI